MHQRISNVSYGQFWTPGTNYNKFFVDAWIWAEGNAQYVVSAGYGGEHNILFGVDGCSADNTTRITGVVWRIRPCAHARGFMLTPVSRAETEIA